MKIITGDMWSAFESADVFLFTGNGIIERGKLTMGAGMAAQVSAKFKGVEKTIADAVLKVGRQRRDGAWSYGLVIGKKLGVFQTKFDWRQHSDLGLIEHSTAMLLNYAVQNPDKSIHLNMPGVGRGSLLWQQVLPLVYCLPDNVTLWTQTEWHQRDHYGLIPFLDDSAKNAILAVTDEPDNLFDATGIVPAQPYGEHANSQKHLRMAVRRFVIDYSRQTDYQTPELFVRASWLTPSRQLDVSGHAVLCEPVGEGAALVIPQSETAWICRYGTGRLSDVARTGEILSEDHAREQFPQLQELDYGYENSVTPV